MTIKSLLAAAVVASGLATSATGASAAGLPQLEQLGVDARAVSGVQHVRHHRCHAVRNMCADRWPGHGWRYRRCLRVRGC